MPVPPAVVSFPDVRQASILRAKTADQGARAPDLPAFGTTPLGLCSPALIGVCRSRNGTSFKERQFVNSWHGNNTVGIDVPADPWAVF